ncbi:hypothetical protein DXH95_03040 [Sphingorhabdus pulchriflava]|uniref:Terminase n=1 Tax=Sphingorhabdus pulchriflava TaxID=2292257 RepID=A0A371BFZ0_9SPHN|nr:terminase gpA endonuclease subunit [Sphingorhabdus pulchriflava]RDV06417.1 hypothetical protein DXH95_03040 [Sphingorhabdus pulchriflava]
MLDIGQNQPLEFTAALAVVGECLSGMRFPEKVKVSVAARRHRVLNNPGAYSGPWGEGPYFTDHLDRPMDCLMAESPYREVAVMGPSQVGKSEIGNNWQLHKAIYDPSDMMFLMPDRTSIDSYIKTQFNKMIELTPELSERLINDTINLKQFRGLDLHFLWPVGSSFRARPIPCGRLDDSDEFPTDIGDQGDAVSLLAGRMGSFEAYGRTMMYINSTPKLGPGAGIEALVAVGTDERFYVDCLQCGDPFALYFDRLDYEKAGTPEDAATSAKVVCPSCGGIHMPGEKRRLLETYRWVGKGEKAEPRSEYLSGKTGELLPNLRASFRFDGLFGFRSWADIARRARAAEISFEMEQDEGPLKAFDQTIVGRNFRPRQQGEEPVSEDELVKRAKASPYRMGEVPPGVRVLVASIDQQGNRFEVSVWGFGWGFRAWLIDRWAELTIEENGRQRPLRPFKNVEDWSVIHSKVMAKSYPMAGAPNLRMKIFNTVVDTGGLDGATDNAFEWWYAMVKGDAGSGRAALPATAITLLKGGNNPKAKLLPPPTVDAKRQIKGVEQAEMYVPNVSRFKDIANVRLNRRDDGPGYISFPSDIPHEYLAELRAEYKNGDQWERPQHTANETWDLYIYAYVAIVRFGGSDASLSWVPEWARPPRDAPAKIDPPAISSQPVSDAPKVVSVQRPSAPPRAATPRRRGVRSVRAH